MVRTWVRCHCPVASNADAITIDSLWIPYSLGLASVPAIKRTRPANARRHHANDARCERGTGLIGGNPTDGFGPGVRRPMILPARFRQEFRRRPYHPIIRSSALLR